MAEVYLGIAVLFRRFNFQLFDVVQERDIDNVRDCFVGETSHQSRGVRAKIESSIWG